MQAEELVEFWISQCKTRIEARTDKCLLRNHVVKGKRMRTPLTEQTNVARGVPSIPTVVDVEWLDASPTAPLEANDLDIVFDYGVEMHANECLESSKLRSSEVPPSLRSEVILTSPRNLDKAVRPLAILPPFLT